MCVCVLRCMACHDSLMSSGVWHTLIAPRSLVALADSYPFCMFLFSCRLLLPLWFNPTLLHQVCSDVDAFMASTPDSAQAIEAVKHNIDQTSHSGSNDALSVQLQPVVVWQEFVKELVATIEMTNMLFPDLE